MALCTGTPHQTSLQRFASTLQQHKLDEQVSPQETFPMFTMGVSIFLEMTKIQPHEELLAAGKLSVFDESMGRAAFVSHQWIGDGHPDPEFKQMKVLQDTLTNLISGRSEVSVDLITEAVYFRSKGIPAAEWKSTSLFLWYDYFSCPQLDHTDGNGSNNAHLQKAIESIPVYVSRSYYFIALCPVLASADREETFSDYTWSQRGWCCVEQTVRELADNQGGAGSWIMVKSSTHQELKVSPLTSSSPGEGEFSVESDRAAVGEVLRKFLIKKLMSCLAQKNFAQYRLLLNQQTSFFRGLPVERFKDVLPPQDFGGDVAEAFLYQNGFQHPNEFDAAGWSPLCYAAMYGDPNVMNGLLERGGNPNEKTRGQRPEINTDKGTSILSICARFKNHDVMRLLIEKAAAINSKAVHTPLGQACLTNDAIGVRILCEAKADPHLRNPFGDHALNMAAASGSCDAIDVLLSVSSDYDLSRSLHTAVLLQGGSSKVMWKLLQAGAHVDEPYRQTGSAVLGVLHRIKGFQFQFGKKTMFRRVGYHIQGATPLMLAIICGNFEAAATLLVEGARITARNKRGKSALDLITDLDVPDYLLEAIEEGDMRKCTSIVSNSFVSSSKSFVRQDSTSSVSSCSTFGI